LTQLRSLREARLPAGALSLPATTAFPSERRRVGSIVLYENHSMCQSNGDHLLPFLEVVKVANLALSKRWAEVRHQQEFDTISVEDEDGPNYEQEQNVEDICSLAEWMGAVAAAVEEGGGIGCLTWVQG